MERHEHAGCLPRSASLRRRAPGRSGTHAYLADRGLATAIHLALSLDKPLLARRGGRCREDRGGEGAGRATRAPADPPTVLRGNRRLAGALRVELRAPAPGPCGPRTPPRQNGTWRTCSVRSSSWNGPCSRRSARALERSCSSTSSTAPTTSSRRSFWRSSRSSRLRPRGRAGRGGVAAGGRRDVESHPGAARRAEAAVPLPHGIQPPRTGSARSRSSAPALRTSGRRSPATWPRRSHGSSRALDLAKLPGVAETIDWANALAFLGAERLSPETARDTLGAVVKDHEDQELVEPRLVEVVGDRDG